jgi:hypothetical protein
VWETGEVHTGFWWEDLREGDHLGRPRHRWEDNIKMDLQELGLGAWTGLIWLRIGTGSRECGNEASGSIKYGEFVD